jgi:hypothetical protein
MDTVESTVGTYIPGTVQAHTQLQSLEATIIDPATRDVIETVRSNVPDLITVHGEFKTFY